MNTDQPFTPLFQRELAVLLLKDPTAYGQYHEVWKPSYFDDVNQRKIVYAFLQVREIAGEHPTETSMVQQLLNGVKDVRQPLPMDKEELLKELGVLYAAAIPQNKKFSFEIMRK